MDESKRKTIIVLLLIAALLLGASLLFGNLRAQGFLHSDRIKPEAPQAFVPPEAEKNDNTPNSSANLGSSEQIPVSADYVGTWNALTYGDAQGEKDIAACGYTAIFSIQSDGTLTVSGTLYPAKFADTITSFGGGYAILDSSNSTTLLPKATLMIGSDGKLCFSNGIAGTEGYYYIILEKSSDEPIDLEYETGSINEGGEIVYYNDELTRV